MRYKLCSCTWLQHGNFLYVIRHTSYLLDIFNDEIKITFLTMSDLGVKGNYLRPKRSKDHDP